MRTLFLVTLILACFCALFLCCYAPALFQDRQFGFRDAGHFYYPLHARVQQEWNERRWPLWEPEENGGMPLLGNPTAAVLYPGKVVFALLPYSWAARIYIVAHSVLAFAAMLILMRAWGIGWAGSGLSALSYTFGAPILFQYCNIIYLVGAAWLPLGMHAVDRWVRLGRRWAIVELALVLGMQTLGGDPQSAFLVGIAGLGYAFALDRARRRSAAPRALEESGTGRARRGRGPLLLATAVGLIAVWFITTVILGIAFPKLRPAHDGPPTPPLPWITAVSVAVLVAWLALGNMFLYRWRGRPWRIPLGAMWLGLAISAVLATAATAAQLFPIVEFTQQTSRAANTGTHELYAFSIEPYRLIEMIWPNVWGAQFGGNTYWAPLMRLPGSYPKIWVPSLYLGGLTFVLALPVFTLRKAPPWRAWLSLITIVSIVGALGEYTSPIWMTRAIAATSRSTAIGNAVAELGPVDKLDSGVIREDGFLRDGDGSVYWLLGTLLPGFRQFRYPAKLFTFTALGFAALAGVGWDRLGSGRVRAFFTSTAILLGVTVCTLVAVLLARQSIQSTLQGIVSSSTFGPLDATGAFRAIIRCLSHAAIVLALGLLLIFTTRARPTVSAALMLLLVSCDLAVANARFVFTIPQSLFESKPEVLELIEAEERARPSPGPFRVHRMALWNPPGWSTTPSPDRVSDFVTWERDTLQPKYGIDLGVEYTHTIGVAELYDFEWFFYPFPRTVRDESVARSLSINVGDTVIYYPRRGFDLWNSRYFILPCFPNGWNDGMRATAAFLDQSRSVYPKFDQFSGPGGKEQETQWIFTKDFRILRNEQAFPRAWIVHRARAVERPVGLSRESRSAAVEEMLYANDRFWHDDDKVSFDAHQIAWVASDDMTEVVSKLSNRQTTSSEKVKVTYPSPQQVVLDVDLESPGLVVLADVSYPGWQLTIDDQPAKIYRVNQLMRGALVPAKHHQLVYTFAPQSFQLGLVVSGMGLAGLLLFGLFCTLRPVDPVLAAAALLDSPSVLTSNALDRSTGGDS
jgi:hypothetical protein